MKMPVPPDIYFQKKQPPLLEDQLANQVTKINPENTTFLKQYLEVTRYHHEKGIQISAKEVAKNLPLVLLSYGVGGAAAIGYIGVAKKAAGDNPINAVLYTMGALTLNWIVNGYFFNLVISSACDSLTTHKPQAVEQALDGLKSLTTGLSAKVMRGLKQAGITLVILAPAIASAVPFYILDKEGGDSDFTATIVLASATMLQYKGVEAMFYKGIPALFSPFKACYRRANYDALKAHKILTTITKLKEAHRNALNAAHQEILRLLQTKNEEYLSNILPLLTKKNPSKQDSLLLLMKLLKLGKKDEFQGSPTGRTIFQIASLIFTLASLPGYYIITVEGAAEYLELDDAFTEWLLGSAIFLVSVALSLDVGWLVGSYVYDLTAYALNGVKKSWGASDGIFDFASKAWHNKGNIASWQNLVQLPLPVLQNPRIMLALRGFLSALSYWSTQTSTYLNEQTLGRDISGYLKLPTIVSVMLFNLFPVDMVLGGAQGFFARLFGTARTLDEIKLAQFLQDQGKFVEEIEPDQLLEILKDIVNNDTQLKYDEIEDILKIFFGNKEAADIFGAEHKYAKKDLQVIVSRLADKNIGELSRIGSIQGAIKKVGFFANPANTEENILLSHRKTGYGTDNDTEKMSNVVW